MQLRGPSLMLRYATPDDAPRLFELASDPLVTRWFSWGPYASADQPLAYIASLAPKRKEGALLDFLIVHDEHGPIGVTGLSELSTRNRHATVGSWFGRAYWGTGANRESKALIAYAGFELCGLDRLTAWANTRNGRSQLALERAGFRREGVLRDWHRHGDQLHDVCVFGLTRRAWERGAGALREIPVEADGTPPRAWRPADAST